jgi:hypothetical protein
MAVLGRGSVCLLDEERGKWTEVLLESAGFILGSSSTSRRYVGSSKKRIVWAETSTNHNESHRQRLEREAEIMYKYRFRFKGGGKRVDNKNFKFHCFISDSEAVEHHLFEAKNKGLIVNDQEVPTGTDYVDPYLYESAMPIVKVFSSTSGFGIPKEYFSYFFLVNPGSKKMIKIKPLGFDKDKVLDDWYFLAPGRFMTKAEIRKFFGATSDTWKFYQRQSFISRRRLLEMVEVGENHHIYDGEVITENEEEIRMVRLD